VLDLKQQLQSLKRVRWFPFKLPPSLLLQRRFLSGSFCQCFGPCIAAVVPIDASVAVAVARCCSRT
jgi:hypothetical protein